MSANVVLHACAAKAGRLRIWLGVRERTTVPVLSWTLEGQGAQPAALRPIQSVRAAPFLGTDTPRVFTGLYEFPVPPGPARAFRVGVSLDGAAPVVSVLRSVPACVPTGLEEAFQLMLSSCFYWDEDRGGMAGLSMDTVLRGCTPDLLLLLGDQVYLDLPPLVGLPQDRAGLARKFEQDYVRNWFEDSAYAKVLHAAPFAAVPDDHDYWNNFPMSQVQAQNTWTGAGRAAWTDAARMLYGQFQHVDPTPVGTPVQLDVEPLSFFLLDARSFRDGAFKGTMTPEARDALSAWVTHCITERKLGVFATGQLLTTAPLGGGFNRHFGDTTMNNYGDFPFLMGELDRLMRQAGDVLLLTGDMHWSRVAQLVPKDALATGMQMIEVVSSPTSLVTTPVQDPLHKLGARKGDLWPRHSDAALLGGTVALEGTQSSFFAYTQFRNRGNSVCTLSFRRRGENLEVTPRFFPLLPGAQPVTANPFLLSHR
jgi:hypothetical protein